MYHTTKGVKNISDTQKKSRAKYFQERRKNKVSFSVLLDKDRGLAIEEHLKLTNKTKKVNRCIVKKQIKIFKKFNAYSL